MTSQSWKYFVYKVKAGIQILQRTQISDEGYRLCAPVLSTIFEAFEINTVVANNHVPG